MWNKRTTHTKQGVNNKVLSFLVKVDVGKSSRMVVSGTKTCKMHREGEGLRGSFATPNPIILTKKICLNQMHNSLKTDSEERSIFQSVSQ